MSSSSSSAAGQQQFRYAQTPSKVLHLRNLPWECAEEELVELCKPFGKIVNTKCNVGANRNQAFVEFVDLNQAISMVSYYASSSEPAQIRGKTVYIQYSNRQEIVNNKSSGDVAGNVLLVTIEGIEAGDVTIDIIHLVFSAFGFVHKIATFEKAAGFQALIQYSDAETASEARNSLDGRSIPRYLLPDRVESCHLRISFSAHTDLNIKFQSHRSRDYTNPYLPVNPSAIEGTFQPVVGPDGNQKEPESNVLLASIGNMQYVVTVDVIHTVFSAFGTVQKIAIFEKNGGIQALVQYPDIPTAAVAKEALEGHCIYDGGYCKLHLSYSRHTDLNVKGNNDRSRDYTLPDTGVVGPAQAPVLEIAATVGRVVPMLPTLAMGTLLVHRLPFLEGRCRLGIQAFKAVNKFIPQPHPRTKAKLMHRPLLPSTHLQLLFHPLSKCLSMASLVITELVMETGLKLSHIQCRHNSIFSTPICISKRSQATINLNLGNNFLASSRHESTAAAVDSTEPSCGKYEYQAEVSRLMDLVVHNLYSNKEVFPRELVRG